MIKDKRCFFTGMLIACVAVVLDQLSKWWLLDVVEIGNRPPLVVTDFFNLVMVWNHGISFGMLSDHRMPLFLIALALVIVVILTGWLAKSCDRMSMIGTGLVIGGALGNVIDRMRFGAVADFLDFHIAGMHWPAFNVADSVIFIGVVVLCIQSIIAPKNNEQDPS